MKGTDETRWLVTGGCGFIGSHFVRFLLDQDRAGRVVNLDALTYAGRRDNLEEVAGDPRYELVHGDITDGEQVERILRDLRPRYLVNLAAESHVDRSIRDPAPFLRTNVQGTHTLLECLCRHRGARFIQVSTDEVYGSVEAPALAGERGAMRPSSPYAASKASADLLVRAYRKTWGLDTVVTRCCNNLGPRQHPEKLVPRMILHALADWPLPVYGDGLNVRDWIWVEDHCEAIYLAATRGRAGAIYNVPAGQHRTNLEVVKAVLDILGRQVSLLAHVPDRPGHDRRYAMSGRRAARELGFTPRTTFERSLSRTVAWYLSHEAWWRT